MGAVRRLTQRVKRWRGGKMILRWTVTAVADAADRFRRVNGARDGMTALVRALKDHENAATGSASRKHASETCRLIIRQLSNYDGRVSRMVPGGRSGRWVYAWPC